MAAGALGEDSKVIGWAGAGQAPELGMPHQDVFRAWEPLNTAE